MKIRTLTEARIAIADCQRRGARLPARFEVTEADWFDMLGSLCGSEPVDMVERTIGGVPVKIVPGIDGFPDNDFGGMEPYGN